MALFTKPELQAYLQLEVTEETSPGLISDETYAVVVKVVEAWLADAVGLRPAETFADRFGADTPPQLASWALELGAITYENPASAATDTTDKVSVGWSTAIARRDKILERAAAWARGDSYDGVVIATPTGSFPPAQPWPSDLGGCW